MVDDENNIDRLLDNQLGSETFLSEEEAKKIIKLMGISVPKGHVVSDFAQAQKIISQLGFPIVVKGLVDGITHKSDYGLVKTGISNELELENCISQMTSKCKEISENYKFLIEQQKSGSLEIVAGLTTDTTFGKVIMFGLGGIFVEVIKDVSFKLCPITRKDAEDMISSLQTRSLFYGARGKKPVDIEKVVDFLMSIGGRDGIAGRYGDRFDTLEINPAIIEENDNITALDAVVKLPPKSDREEKKPDLDYVDLTKLFNPKTIAVVGVSPDKPSFAKEFLDASLRLGFKGNVYPINIKQGGKEVLGWPIFDRLTAVPEEIDYLYVCIPAAAVPNLLKDAKDKVHFAHIITSGFGEVGDEGKKTEEKLLTAARESNVRLIGPNCLGMYSPESGITLIEGASKTIGNIGIISQSGGLTTDIVRMGGAMGLKFSKAISIGNSVDLNVEDFLSYMGRDPKTKIIGIYAEQLKDGERFTRLLSEISKVKPVLILKGGRSRLGAQAASSHTGALASDIKLWEAMCKQHGGIMVNSLNEFVNTLLCFQNLDPSPDNTLFLFGQSGGTTVLAADACDDNGLAVPMLDEQLERKILSMGIPPGTSVKNPIDAPIGTLAVGKGKIVRDIFDVVSSEAEFSYDLMHFNVQNVLSFSRVGLEIVNNMVNIAIERGGLNGPRSRRLALVIRGNREQEVEDIVREQTKRATQAGVPVFPEIDDALKSIGMLVKYGKWLTS